MQRFLSNRFEVIERLDRSDHALSFLGEDRWSGKTVFVKWLRGRSHRKTARFQEQLASYHGLSHPLLSSIRYAGHTPKHDQYFVRDWYDDGHELANETADRDAVVSRLLAAMRLLRSLGIVHGRIKPSNIWIHKGTLTLLDGGLPSLESSWLKLEELPYVAPEIHVQAEATFESDLYSLGAVLYRIYSGRDLFEDSDTQLLRRKCIHAKSAPLFEVSETPKTLSRLISRLVSKNPLDRVSAFGRLLRMFSPEVGVARKAPLAGRRDELNRAQSILCGKGKGMRIVSIEGDAGTGKTRLVEELAFRHELGRGHFLIGRSYERGNRQFEPILQIVSERFKRRDKRIEDWIRKDGGGFAYSLTHLLPELKDDFALRTGDFRLTTAKLVADLVGTLVAMTKDDPSLVISIEDIHWVDESTLQVLQQLILRSGEASIRLVVTGRMHSGQGVVHQIFEGFRDPGIEMEKISLAPLNRNVTRQMARLLTSNIESLSWIVQESGGYPLFVEACAQYQKPGTNKLPPKVSDVLIEKANCLPALLKPLVEFLAFFPKPVPIELAYKFVNLVPAANRNYFDDLVAAGILVRRAEEVSFCHDGIRESIYKQISSGRRYRFHRAIHGMLLSEGVEARTLAHHAERGGLLRQAAIRYEEAAIEYKSQSNYREAIDLFLASRRLRKRIGEPPSTEAEVSYGEALGSAGKTLQARKTFLRILEIVPPHSELRAALYRHLGACCRDSHDESVRFHALAISHLPKGSSKLVQFQLNLAQAYSSAGRAANAQQAIIRVNRCLAVSRTSTRGIFAIKGSILLALCQYGPALIVLRREGQRDSYSAVALNNIAVCIEHIGDLNDACKEQTKALVLSRQLGLLFGELQSLANLGAFQTKRGDFKKASALFNEADRFCRTMNIYRDGNRTNLPLLAVDQAGLQMMLGKYSLAQRFGKLAVRRLKSDLSSQKACWVALKVAELYCNINETTKARKALARVQDSELYHTDFFKVEHVLAMCQIAGSPRPVDRGELETALRLTRTMGTLYQRCRVLIELAIADIAESRFREARSGLIEAQKLANRCHYGVLRPRIALWRAFATESAKSKHHYLEQAYQLATKLPLPELVAEAAFHLAGQYLEKGHLLKAHAYISESVTTTETLAAEVPPRSRQRYLRLGWRLGAAAMLKEIENQLQHSDPERKSTAMSPQVGRLSRTLYATTVSLAEAKNSGALAEIVRRSLSDALKGQVVVCLNVDESMEFYAHKAPVDDALARKLSKLSHKVNTQTYYGTDFSHGKGSASSVKAMAWVPLTVRNNRFGGIYVGLGSRRFSEAEMEFLTSIGVVASHVLAAILWSSVKTDPSGKKRKFDNIVGRSRQIQEVCSQIEIAAKSNATVLIEGESGTGKELVARAIHESSDRAHAPLITVDCGAIPDTLVESELFGSRKGAFTGATADRAGLVEAAHQGTLFLDEISNTSPSLQVRLLRVLQEKQVRRIGDAKDRTVDMRLIAATNSNLESLVERGQFRQDLFYRLNVLHITIPPLRKRKEDISEIAIVFLDRLNKANKTRKRFSARALDQLKAGQYRGNVRELQNIVERAYFLTADSDQIKEVAVSPASAAEERNQVNAWISDLREGRTDFWSAIHRPYKRRDISREKVVALMDAGLRETRGSYKSVAKMFRVKDQEYRRFMDFLRRNGCHPDFRPYRRLGLD